KDESRMKAGVGARMKLPRTRPDVMNANAQRAGLSANQLLRFLQNFRGATASAGKVLCGDPLSEMSRGMFKALAVQPKGIKLKKLIEESKSTKGKVAEPGCQLAARFRQVDVALQQQGDGRRQAGPISPVPAMKKDGRFSPVQDLDE